MRGELLFITNSNANNMTSLIQSVLSRKFTVKTVNFDEMEILENYDSKKTITVAINIKNITKKQFEIFDIIKSKIIEDELPLIVIGGKEEKYSYNELLKMPNSINMIGFKLTDIADGISKLLEEIGVKLEEQEKLEENIVRKKKIMLIDDDAMLDRKSVVRERV